MLLQSIAFTVASTAVYYVLVKRVDVLLKGSDGTVREAKRVVEVRRSKGLRRSGHDELIVAGTLVQESVMIGPDTVHRIESFSVNKHTNKIKSNHQMR